MLPDITTFPQAVTLARDARIRGVWSIHVVANAQNRRGVMAGRVRAWREMQGVDGWIVSRILDEDGVAERFVLLVDVVDVLAAEEQRWIASLQDIPAAPPRRRAFSFQR